MDAPNFTRRRWPGNLFLAVLTAGTLIALILTRPPQPRDYFQAHGNISASDAIVDQRHLQTAQALGAIATTQEELAFVRDAIRIADADVDLAFSIALREIASHPAPLTAESRELQERISHAQLMVQQDSNRSAQLQKQIAAAGTRGRDALEVELDLAEAQLALSQSQLSDARQDFQRAGGDPLSRIQRQFQQHELARHDVESVPPNLMEKKSSPNYGTSNLVAQAIASYDLRGNCSPYRPQKTKWTIPSLPCHKSTMLSPQEPRKLPHHSLDAALSTSPSQRVLIPLRQTHWTWF